MEIKGDFSEGDPLIVVSGNTLCSAVAKVGSDQARTAEKAILIRDVGKVEKAPFGKRASRQDFVAANRRFLEGLESKGVSDIKSFVGNRELPVTLSFSGGKDSLAAYGIAKKGKLKITLIFIDTGLEFPDTVDYVRNFVASTTNSSSSPRPGTRSGSRWTPSGRRPRTSAGAARSASWVR